VPSRGVVAVCSNSRGRQDRTDLVVVVVESMDDAGTPPGRIDRDRRIPKKKRERELIIHHPS
jgi:hypothetical protein